MRGATIKKATTSSRFLFQSTRPMRGATANISVMSRAFLFQSTRPMRGATRHDTAAGAAGNHFNPRAPCGARPRYPRPQSLRGYISIHAPHAGRDVSKYWSPSSMPIFQSTRPMRGATHSGLDALRQILVISIHAPHAGRDLCDAGGLHSGHISIHAPHAGRDGAKPF